MSIGVAIAECSTFKLVEKNITLSLPNIKTAECIAMS